MDADKGYVKDDSISLEVFVKADAPHGVRSVQRSHYVCVAVLPSKVLEFGTVCRLNCELLALLTLKHSERH